MLLLLQDLELRIGSGLVAAAGAGRDISRWKLCGNPHAYAGTLVKQWLETDLDEWMIHLSGTGASLSRSGK